MRDSQIKQVQGRREDARLAATVTFYLTLCTGFVVTALMALSLSWYVIAPITRLEGYARRWQLGQAWELKPWSSNASSAWRSFPSASACT